MARRRSQPRACCRRRAGEAGSVGGDAPVPLNPRQRSAFTRRRTTRAPTVTRLAEGQRRAAITSPWPKMPCGRLDDAKPAAQTMSAASPLAANRAFSSEASSASSRPTALRLGRSSTSRCASTAATKSPRARRPAASREIRFADALPAAVVRSRPPPSRADAAPLGDASSCSAALSSMGCRASHRISSHIIAHHRTSSHRISSTLCHRRRRTSSHRISSHIIASHDIASHTSHRIASHRIASHRIASIASHRISEIAPSVLASSPVFS